MADLLTYTLSLQGNMDAKLQKIGITSDTALNKFAKLQQQALQSQKVMKDMGGSVGALRQKLELLKAEKEWIPRSNLTDIRKYNTEITKLTKEINKLDTINGSAFKRNLKGAVQVLPFSELITNPVAQAGVALFQSTKMALNFEEGMAKINTTAQLSDKDLNGLRKKLISIGRDTNADLNRVPDAFEKILSQTEDVSLSVDILEQALKGSKGGFTDADVVASALAQTLSLVGKENTNAREVLDTLFAAKRVGAGEFGDFAQFLPNLIASGKSLSLGFKETAGIFAFMTGKGQSAERAAVLMNNAFTVLGRTEITDKLKANGIEVFDAEGAVRGIDKIFTDLNKKLTGLTAEGKANFLDSIGLRDKEAKAAFEILASDTEKLSRAISETANSQGEAQKAFERSQTSIEKLRGLWTDVQAVAISLGGAVATVLGPAFAVLAIAVSPVVDVLTWFFDGIAEGNPLVLTFAGTIGILAAMMNFAAIKSKLLWLWNLRLIISQKVLSFWFGLVSFSQKLQTFWTAALAVAQKGAAIATGILTGALWGLNVAMDANPIGFVIALIVALIAVVITIKQKYDDWGAALSLVLGPMGQIIRMIQAFSDNWQSIIDSFKTGGFIAGIKRIGLVLVDTLIKPAQQLAELLDGLFGGDTVFGKFADKQREVREKINTVTEGERKAREVQTGIEAPEIPGLSTSEAAKQLGLTNFSPNPEASKSTNAVAIGGTKQTTINIQLGKFFETINITGKDFRENTRELETQVTDAMLRVLGSAQTAAV
ncbi:MAG: phage tail tape measure protein [Bacteroidetes bacterium]|nr:phage tail tape measure protein [Bacteroidota bacterium]